jgi:hypothetical protein
MIRMALIFALVTAPALAQEVDACGACTELDRATMADPVTPSLPLMTPKPASAPDRGKPIELAIPGINTPPVWYRAGSGLWISDATPGGVYIKPKKDKFSIDMRF